MILNKSANERLDEISKIGPWVYNTYREMMLYDKLQQILEQDRLMKSGRQPNKDMVELVADLFLISGVYLTGEQDLIATRLIELEKYTHQEEMYAKLQRGQEEDDF